MTQIFALEPAVEKLLHDGHITSLPAAIANIQREYYRAVLIQNKMEG
jgi:hypothetical protein